MDAGKAIRLAMMVAKSIGMPAKASGGEVTNSVSDEDMLKTHNAQRVGLGLPDGTCPEDMFNSEVNPNINHGAGAYQYSLEHIGDLVHRLSYTDRLGGGVGYGMEAALTKASRNYDLKPHFLERLLNSNYEYKVKEKGYKGSFDDFKKEFNAAADRYADAYEKIPVHTELQAHGRDAAVALGRRDFPKVQKHLDEIKRRLSGDNAKEEYWKPHKASGGAVDGDSIPDAPGTTPVKDGYVRLYHQTSEDNLGQIEKNGLLLKHARGIEGPRAIYAGETPFYREADSHPTLEFQVPKKHWQSPFVLQDVMPEDFIAAHYPGHRDARYLEENNLVENALNGKYDELSGDTAKAVDYIKRKYATKKAGGGEVSGYENGGMPGDDGDSLLPQGRAQQRMASNLAAGPQPTNIAKEPGGQWLSGSVESAVKPLKVDRMDSLSGMQSPADALAVSKERLSAMDARQASGGTSPLNDRDFQALRALLPE